MTRTIPIVLCTESPIPTFDPRSGVIVDEILRISGLEHNGQCPLCDSHAKDSVRDVLGSVRDIRSGTVDGVPALLGTAHFTAAAVDVFELYAGGHISAFSVGARRKAIERREDGTRIVTQSELVECSTVVKGADPAARALRTVQAQLTGERAYQLLSSGDLEEFESDPAYGQEFELLARCFPDAGETELIERAIKEVRKKFRRSRYFR